MDFEQCRQTECARGLRITYVHISRLKISNIYYNYDCNRY